MPAHSCFGSSMRVAIRAVASLLVPAALLAQIPQPATGTGIIRGRVLQADSGQPLVRATVKLQGSTTATERFASTDGRGGYEFTGLPAGPFSIYVSKSGYVGRVYGRRDARDMSPVAITLTERQVVDSIDVALSRAGVIEGRVIDQHGEPVQRARVESMRRRYASGERSLTKDEGRSATETDDLGRFRIYNLDAGAHYLSVSQSTLIEVAPYGQPKQAFYPGTVSPAEAQPIVLKTGQAVELVMQLPAVRYATVSGSVRLTDGRAARVMSVTLSNGLSRRASVEGNTFSVANVAPGDYLLSIQTDAKEALLGKVNVAGADVTLSLTTSTGAPVRGRIVFDGERPASLAPRDVRITPAAAPALAGEMPPIADDWTFDASGIIGSGLIRMSGSGRGGQPSSWTLKSVLRRGVDVTDTPLDFTAGVDDLEIVLTTRTSGVTGRVVDKSGAPVRDATVVVFADDRQRWGLSSRFVRNTRSDQSGRFSIPGLLPGRYLAVSADFVEAGDELDPVILDGLRRTALPLTLDEGATPSVDLRLDP